MVSIKYVINEFIGGKIFLYLFIEYCIENEAISRPIGTPYYQYPALRAYQLTEAERGGARVVVVSIILDT